MYVRTTRRGLGVNREQESGLRQTRPYRSAVASTNNSTWGVEVICTLLPRVQTAEDACMNVLERHRGSFVARAGGRQSASMGLYSAIGPDEYSYDVMHPQDS